MRKAESQQISKAEGSKRMPLSSLFVHLEDVATTRRYHPKQAKSSSDSWL